MNESIQSVTALAQTSIALTTVYLSLITGYLITAYVAANNLARVQLWIINFLFVVSTFAIAHGAAMYGAWSGFESAKLSGLDGGRLYGFLFWGWFATLLVGVGASLYFMYSCRKSDDDT